MTSPDVLSKLAGKSLVTFCRVNVSGKPTMRTGFFESRSGAGEGWPMLARFRPNAFCVIGGLRLSPADAIPGEFASHHLRGASPLIAE
jgi:hypothetical protein